MIEKLVDFLLKSQNIDGGWGVIPGKRSQTEATALALLGLWSVQDRTLTSLIEQGLRWLSIQQKEDGSWPVSSQVVESSWSTTFAILALTAMGVQTPRVLRGTQWLLEQKGQTLGWRESIRYRWAPETMVNLLNPDLQGWSWVPFSFSWVEPTAYAVIVLKKLKALRDDHRTRGRIRQGELLLYDRMCTDGGWNYGNKFVFGETIPPYPDTTAISLIALQEQQKEEKNQRSLQVLVNLLDQTQSGLTLSWAICCASLYGLDDSKWRTSLAAVYEKTKFLGETKSHALALLALVDAHVFAFRV
jgi:squalene cyclase